MPKSADTGLKVRIAALNAINQVLIEGHPLKTEVIQSLDLTSSEKAMVNRIANSTLRHFARADFVLERMMKRKPPIRVLNLMRMALTERYACNTKAYAVVDSAVRIVEKDYRHFRLKGFVNAILRKSISQEGQKLWLESDPPKLPNWIAKPIIRANGKEVLRKIEKSHETDAPLDLTPKNRHQSGKLAELLGATLLDNGSLRLQQPRQVSKLCGFSKGDWWVQDYASSLAIDLLGNLNGLSVLDLCAAPGGKTLQCSAKGANVTSLDRSNKRLSLLHSNLKRTGLKANTIHCDAFEWNTDKKFDVVVVDAPCSATGTIRRHPDLPYRNQPVDWLDTLTNTQKKMIEKAISLVNPYGRILYCVCSLLPQEGEHVVKWAKEKFQLKVEHPENLVVNNFWRSWEDGIRTRPDYWQERGGMDGFYAACLRVSVEKKNNFSSH